MIIDFTYCGAVRNNGWHDFIVPAEMDVLPGLVEENVEKTRKVHPAWHAKNPVMRIATLRFQEI